MGEHRWFWRVTGILVLVTAGLAAWAGFAGTGADKILAQFLPGKFGPGFDPAMTGNLLFLALILFADSLILLGMGLGTLCNVARKTLLIAPDDLDRLLRRAAGLSQEDIAAAHFAVAEEQKAEIEALRHGRAVTLVGGVLLAIAFAAVCFGWARADFGGALLAGAGGNLPNASLTPQAVLLFAGNQLANALLLDAPLVLRWQLSSLWAGDTVLWFKPFVLAFHVLAKFAVFAVLLAWWRLAHLRAYVQARTRPEAGLRTMEIWPATAQPQAAAAERNEPTPNPAADGSDAIAVSAGEAQLLPVQDAQDAHGGAVHLPPQAEPAALAEAAEQPSAEPLQSQTHEQSGAQGEDESVSAPVHNIPTPPISPQEWRSLH